ncbi:uncharacterized protein LOC142171904 [Nicotiana tabacum]|uniref:Uncharacterized protein LOC142171904 n=1 Tax=Nicotiana tabacum TaxID=4097 RepID=A0AC58T3B0_TOBAC
MESQRAPAKRKEKGVKRKTPHKYKLLMNFIIWNSKGANSAKFRRHCSSMVKLHNLTVLLLLETHMADYKHLANELHFSDQFQSPTNGQSGDIVVMWKDDLIKLEEISTAPQGVHVMVKVHSPPNFFFLSAIYASNTLSDGIKLWDHLVDIAFVFKGGWLVGGDFNEVLKSKDKFGGNSISAIRANHFWNRINKCNLFDLGFKGSKYTWSNKR